VPHSRRRGPAGVLGPREEITPERRFFTVAEANALLPEVKRLLQEMRSSLAGLEELRAKLTGPSGELEKPKSDTAVDRGHFQLASVFQHSLGRFNELGIEIKDVSRGLIDFPAQAAGEEICLCWQDGEDAVRFYHDLESGFAGRKPIEQLADRPPVPDPDDGSDEG
jgi:hypothetical protein